MMFMNQLDKFLSDSVSASYPDKKLVELGKPEGRRRRDVDVSWFKDIKQILNFEFTPLVLLWPTRSLLDFILPW